MFLNTSRDCMKAYSVATSFFTSATLTRLKLKIGQKHVSEHEQRLHESILCGHLLFDPRNVYQVQAENRIEIRF